MNPDDIDDDKVRILTAIVVSMASNFDIWRYEGGRKPVDGGEHEMGAWVVNMDEPPIGSLIVCKSSGLHPFTVGFVQGVEQKTGAFGSSDDGARRDRRGCR